MKTGISLQMLLQEMKNDPPFQDFCEVLSKKHPALRNVSRKVIEEFAMIELCINELFSSCDEKFFLLEIIVRQVAQHFAYIDNGEELLNKFIDMVKKNYSIIYERKLVYDSTINNDKQFMN